MPRLYTDYTKDKDGKEIWNFKDVDHINFYLTDGPDIYVKSRSTPLCPVPKMISGNMLLDGGHLTLSEDEKNYFIKKYPKDEKFVKQLMGGDEFLNNKKRYCLWLVDATPEEIRKNKFIYDRVKKCKEDRLNSGNDKKKLANTPHLFRERVNPDYFIAIPQVSSERREYIPMDFLDKNVIPTFQLRIIPDAEIWQFGILTSSVHMAWMRMVCGRLTSRYRYSAKIVYNNFVWVRMEFIQYAELIMAAEKILKVRKNYPDASLADLYDEITMPKELRDAHKKLDEIVLEIYGFSKKMSDEEIAFAMLENYRMVCEMKNSAGK